MIPTRVDQYISINGVHAVRRASSGERQDEGDTCPNSLKGLSEHVLVPRQSSPLLEVRKDHAQLTQPLHFPSRRVSHHLVRAQKCRPCKLLLALRTLLSLISCLTKHLVHKVILLRKSEGLQAGARNLARIKHRRLDDFGWPSGFAKVLSSGGDRFEVLGNSIENFCDRM